MDIKNTSIKNPTKDESNSSEALYNSAEMQDMKKHATGKKKHSNFAMWLVFVLFFLMWSWSNYRNFVPKFYQESLLFAPINIFSDAIDFANNGLNNLFNSKNFDEIVIIKADDIDAVLNKYESERHDIILYYFNFNSCDNCIKSYKEISKLTKDKVNHINLMVFTIGSDIGRLKDFANDHFSDKNLNIFFISNNQQKEEKQKNLEKKFSELKINLSADEAIIHIDGYGKITSITEIKQLEEITNKF